MAFVTRTATRATHARRALARMSASQREYHAGKHFFLDPFAERQWEPRGAQGAAIVSVSKADFLSEVNAIHARGDAPLRDGYAPFCKHVFVPNFCGLRTNAVALTDDVAKVVKTGYHRRTERELPVLSRWVEACDLPGGEAPVAEVLDVILYSREQIIAERMAREGLDEQTVRAEIPDAPYGVISIKAQDAWEEIPMQPITMMRNALGKEEGGSGVPLERAKYEESVAYWSSHVIIQES